MENYICINGKKAELTEEQLKALGIELPKANPFERVKISKAYNCITGTGKISKTYDLDDVNDRECYKVGNYCTDAVLLQQRALHETLNRLLWRYAEEHNEEEVKFLTDYAWRIIYSHAKEAFEVNPNDDFQTIGAVYFKTKQIALNAIKEIIEPFMKEHPDFKL